MTEDNKTNNTSLWCAYVRVSTKAQAKEGTYKTQEAELQAWADANDFRLKWYRDLGVSGASDKRPAFSEMLRDLTENPKFVGVVAVAVDRFSRKERLIDGLGIIMSIVNTKKAVAVLHQPFGTAGQLAGLPPGTAVDFRENIPFLLLQIYLIAAGDIRAEMIRKTNAGLARRKAKGLPFGPPRKVFDVEDAVKWLERGSPKTEVAKRVLWKAGKRSGVGINVRTLETAVSRWREEHPQKAKASA